MTCTAYSISPVVQLVDYSVLLFYIAVYLVGKKRYFYAELIADCYYMLSEVCQQVDLLLIYLGDIPYLFRGVIGVSPAEYRSGADTDSCAPA